MIPFKDHGIGLIERDESPAVSTTSESTVLIDAHRQGVEVTQIKYFLRSNVPYMSSKGLTKTSINSRISPELDIRDLGQSIEINDFASFEDSSERVAAKDVLANNMIYQSAQDPYYNFAMNDGRISVLSDSGKLDIVNRTQELNSHGIRARIEILNVKDSFNIKITPLFAFYDGVGQNLTIPDPGYAGIESTVDPFEEVNYETSLGSAIDYTYIAPDEKTLPRGFTYYGSSTGTDSIAFGGLLR